MNRERGFTLIEMMVAMLIFSLVIVAVSDVLTSTSRSFGDRRLEADAQRGRRTVMQVFERTLRQAGLNPLGAPGFGIQNALSDQLTFTSDTNLSGTVNPGEQMTYRFDPATSTLRRFDKDGSSGASDVVGSGFQSVDFHYLDASGHDLGVPHTDAATLAQIRTIDVDLTTQGTHADGSTFTRKTTLVLNCPNL